MSRRIALPGADELFRSTGDAPRPQETPPEPVAPAQSGWQEPAEAAAGGPGLRVAEAEETSWEEGAAVVRTVPRRRTRAASEHRPTGRERHEEKITVYVSPTELMDLEHARLALRGDFGLPVDRGRVVREALAIVLADLEAKGEASILVRRLRGR